MNHFYLDTDIKINAQSMHDVHTNKMCVETAQMLSTGLWINNPSKAKEMYDSGHLMKPAHVSTGQMKWSALNMPYLTAYFICLLEESEFRFGKPVNVGYILPSLPEPDFSGNVTPWYFMPYECRIMGSAVKSYRNYYNMHKRTDKNGNKIDFYTRRERPAWFPESR